MLEQISGGEGSGRGGAKSSVGGMTPQASAAPQQQQTAPQTAPVQAAPMPASPAQELGATATQEMLESGEQPIAQPAAVQQAIAPTPTMPTEEDILANVPRGVTSAKGQFKDKAAQLYDELFYDIESRKAIEALSFAEKKKVIAELEKDPDFDAVITEAKYAIWTKAQFGSSLAQAVGDKMKLEDYLFYHPEQAHLFPADTNWVKVRVNRKTGKPESAIPTEAPYQSPMAYALQTAYEIRANMYGVPVARYKQEPKYKEEMASMQQEYLRAGSSTTSPTQVEQPGGQIVFLDKTSETIRNITNPANMPLIGQAGQARQAGNIPARPTVEPPVVTPPSSTTPSSTTPSPATKTLPTKIVPGEVVGGKKVPQKNLDEMGLRSTNINRLLKVEEKVKAASANAFGPVLGRLEQFGIRAGFGHLLTTRQIIELSQALDSALSTQLAESAGKALTATEVEMYTRFFVSLISDKATALSSLDGLLAEQGNQIQGQLDSIPEGSLHSGLEKFMQLAKNARWKPDTVNSEGKKVRRVPYKP
jgi:hypothetical protein